MVTTSNNYPVLDAVPSEGVHLSGDLHLSAGSIEKKITVTRFQSNNNVVILFEVVSNSKRWTLPPSIIWVHRISAAHLLQTAALTNGAHIK